MRFRVLIDMTRYELEKRLISFAVKVHGFAVQLPTTMDGTYFKDQIIRSASSAALNYGEAMSAESGKDFLHKTRLVLKELRETFAALKIIDGIGIAAQKNELEKALIENNELISIFVKTIQTSLKKQQSPQNP